MLPRQTHFLVNSPTCLLVNLSTRDNIYCRKIILLHCALWACGYRAWIKKTLTDYHRCNGVFSRIRFLIFSFDLSFDFDCTLAGQGDFRRILQVAALAFLRAIYVCKIIAYHTTIWITAAASGHACKSVYNPFASKKTKVKKIRVKDSVCISFLC